MDPVNAPTKFEVSSLTRSWDNRGYSKTLGIPEYAHAPFSPKFLMGFFRMDPKCIGQIWSPYLTRSWDIRGYLKTLGSPKVCPRSLFSKIFNGILFGWIFWMYRAKFEVRSFTHSWDNSGYLKTLGSPWICLSRSSKAIDFCTNRKRACDFLLVHHSNLGPILHRFGDIAGFLCSWVIPPLFHPNFGGVPVAPDRPCLGQPE